MSNMKRNMCEFESQDPTKMTSAHADSRINFSWTIMSLLVSSLCLCLVLMNIFQCCNSFSQLCDHVIDRTDWCWQSEQMGGEGR